MDEAPFVPRSTLAAQKKGLAYEKKVGRLVEKIAPIEAEILLGPWIEFEDENGPGVAQPDVVVLAGPWLLIFEAKLTFRKEATKQLELYKPLCEYIWPAESTHQIAVCKNLGIWSDATLPISHTPPPDVWETLLQESFTFVHYIP